MGNIAGTEDRLVVANKRVSSPGQDISRQEVVVEWAAEMFPGRDIVVIEDDGVSAYKTSIFDRPGGRRACDLIASGRVEAICA